LDKQQAVDYLNAVARGTLTLWDFHGKAMIGVSITPTVLWLEFIVGTAVLWRHSQDIVDWVRSLAEGRRIEALSHFDPMTRWMERAGFRAVAKHLRLEDAQRPEEDHH
jgi:hypothetical protein